MFDTFTQKFPRDYTAAYTICLVWWGQNLIYNKIIIRRVLPLSSILAGSEIVWSIKTEQN